jgi:uncharacterized membrane protein YebE (DUF533 family)
MSLLKTLAKVAIGIAVAKGMGGMMKRGQQGGQTGQAPTGSGGGLGDLLGKLGGGQSGGQGGGLGDLLGQLGGQQTRGQQNSGQGGALGDIFGDFIGDEAKQAKNNGSFADMFNEAIEKEDEPSAQPSANQEAVAALMLSAMIQAMKADREISPDEETKLMEHLGDISHSERQFVNQEMQKPVDIAGLVANVPAGLEEQVYLMSIMAIDLDNKEEAQYLHDLASELGIARDQVDAIHTHVGAPTLYS